MRHARPWLVLASAVLAACGDDGAGTDDGGIECPGIDWTDCGASECGTIAVPADHDDPSGETVDLRVQRVRTQETDDRLGVLFGFTNWAGSQVDDSQTVGFLSIVMPEMLRFDRVVFDRRGTGESAPL